MKTFDKNIRETLRTNLIVNKNYQQMTHITTTTATVFRTVWRLATANFFTTHCFKRKFKRIFDIGVLRQLKWGATRSFWDLKCLRK